jgi:hypothetical protein
MFVSAVALGNFYAPTRSFLRNWNANFGAKWSFLLPQLGEETRGAHGWISISTGGIVYKGSAAAQNAFAEAGLIQGCDRSNNFTNSAGGTGRLK